MKDGRFAHLSFFTIHSSCLDSIYYMKPRNQKTSPIKMTDSKIVDFKLKSEAKLWEKKNILNGFVIIDTNTKGSPETSFLSVYSSKWEDMIISFKETSVSDIKT